MNHIGNIISSIVNNGRPAEARKGGRLRDKIIPLLMLLLVIGATAILFIYRARLAELGHYGYLGAFLISLIANATIILPMPGLR